MQLFAQTGYDIAAKECRIQYCEQMTHLPHQEPGEFCVQGPHRIYTAEGKDYRILKIVTFDGGWEKFVVDALTGDRANATYRQYGFTRIVFLEPANGRKGKYVVRHAGKDRSLDMYQFAAFPVPKQ